MIRERSLYLLWNLLTILALSLVVLSQNRQRCPRAENMAPCICQRNYYNGLTMVCSRQTNDSEVARVVSSLKGQTFYQISIRDSNLGNVRPDLFYGLKTHSIELKFSKITSLGEINRPPFLGLEQSLTSLTVEEGFQDRPLSILSLAHLKKLSYVLLKSNVIPSVSNDWFESGPYGLKFLYFQDSSTENLGSHAFASLSELSRLWITGSKIKEITRSMFPKQANNLVEINFNYNQIKYLPNDMFDSMPSLRELNFRSNGFTTISEDALGNVWPRLTTVRIGENPLICDKNLQWIYSYRFPFLLEATCSSPKKLSGMSLTKLKKRDLK